VRNHGDPAIQRIERIAKQISIAASPDDLPRPIAGCGQ